MFCRWPASSLAGVPSLLGVKGGLQGLERGEVWGKSKTQRARHRGHLESSIYNSEVFDP